MSVVSTVFPLVTAATIVVATIIWVITVTFGHLPNSVVPMPGIENWITIIQVCTGTATISTTGLVFVA